MGARRTGARSTLVFAAAVVAVTTLLFAPSFNDGGPEMDEGTLVAYPALVADGLVPGRDFETFYGPAQPYLSAAAGAVLGEGVALERVIGLLMRIAIALSIFALVLRLGRWVALLASVAADLVLLGLGLQALAVLGSIASMLVAIALVAASGERPARWRFAAAGLAAALAIAYRPDMAPAVILGTAPLILLRHRGAWFGPGSGTFYCALAIGLAPLAVWLAVVGADDVSRLVGDLAASREGRRLPLPGVGSAEGQILLAALVVTALDAVTCLVVLGRDRYDERGRLLAAIAIVLVLLTPSAIQRADSAHILPMAAVALGLLPLTVEALVSIGVRSTVTKLILGACALLVAVGFAHQAGGALRSQASSVREGGVVVRVGDRTFPISDAAAATDLQRVLDDLDRIAPPGATVFFGPSDLSRTNYADTFAYFMLPDLRPASFYTEVNPGTANAADSLLPGELRDADFVVLTDRWNISDTDASGERGSTAASEVLADEFCVASRAGTYTLYERCPGS